MPPKVPPPGPTRPKPPGRPKHDGLRDRLYLTPREVEALARAAAAGSPRHGFRDATMVRVAYKHGLRVSELVGLKWAQVLEADRQLVVKRLKNGVNAPHPLSGEEVRWFKRLRKAYPGDYVFASERGGPVSRFWFAQVVRRAGGAAGLPVPACPHMLRHSCGYRVGGRTRDLRLTQAYLGHREVKHTVRYVDLSAERMAEAWDD